MSRLFEFLLTNLKGLKPSDTKIVVTVMIVAALLGIYVGTVLASYISTNPAEIGRRVGAVETRQVIQQAQLDQIGKTIDRVDINLEAARKDTAELKNTLLMMSRSK